MIKGRIKRFSMKRKFEGKYFEFVDSSFSIRISTHLKDILKRKGAKVRIIETKKHGYEVWARK